jgi:hypothetical protein
MFGASILSWALAGAPESPPRAEVTTFDSAAEVIVYDGGEDPYAVIVVQAEPDGRVRLDVDFADGLYLSVDSDGYEATVDTNDREQVSARMLKIKAALDSDPAEIPQWVECAGSVVLAGVACSPPIGILFFVGCAGSSFAAGCACAETFVDGEGSCWND